MKKILSLMLGMSFVFGTLAFAQDSTQGSTADSSKSTKKEKKHKKSKSNDKMASPDSTTAPKQ